MQPQTFQVILKKNKGNMEKKKKRIMFMNRYYVVANIIFIRMRVANT